MIMLMLSDGSSIQLSTNTIGSGGEGKIYAIEKPVHHRHNVAKIFLESKRTSEKEQKLKYLINNPPQIQEGGHTFLIWPIDIIYELGKFIGFIMPKANGIVLEDICTDDYLNWPEYQGTIWLNFALTKRNSEIIRMNIARNICTAVAALHAKKDYVLVDSKPQNIIITEKGLISIIDLDSIQVSKNRNILFASEVMTPDYSPPEMHNQGREKKDYWDRFSLAVIIYRVLTGIHPFSGSLIQQYEKFKVYSDFIKEGFYPHGKHKSKFAVINEPHQKLFNYPDSVVDTFGRAFDTFLFQPDKRPSAIEWIQALEAKPEIIDFFPDKTFVAPNTPVKLTWKVRNGATIKINNGIGEVSGKNSIDVVVIKPMRYYLTVTNIFGEPLESKPVDVVTLNVQLPKSIFIPTPEFDLKFNVKLNSSPAQIPSPIYPNFSTPHINVNTDLSKKINRTINLSIPSKSNWLERLKENYKWTKNILENSNYHLSFEDFMLYKIYKWALQIQTFFSNPFSKNKK